MRGVLAFVSLLVLVVLAWVLTGTGEAPVQGRLQAEPAVTVAPAAKTPELAPTPPERQLAPAAIDGPAANVHVVAFGSDTGVAGVAVRFQRPGLDWQKMSAAERQEYNRLRSDEAAFQQRFGAEALTDAAGSCRVPTDQYGTPLRARSGELYAEGYLAPDQKEPVVLALRADRTLRVRVVDAGGKPAMGVRVQAQRVAASTAADAERQPSVWGLGETKADGRCDYPHSQLIAGKEATFLADLKAQLAGGEGPAVRVDLAAPPTEVVLHLPVTGAVTVHVRDSKGQPLDPGFLGDAKVRLVALAKEPASSREMSDAQNRGEAVSTAIDAGADAHFPFVAFDRWLLVHLGYSIDPLSVAGPTLLNPAIEVTLRESDDDVVLTGTLLQADGAPFAELEFMLSYRSGGSSGSRSARTDARGRMRCNLSSYAKGLQASLGFSTNQLSASDALAIELPPRQLQAGITDLGEVRLQPFTTLVAGRLQCDDGVDCKRANFEIERKVERGWAQEFNLRPEWQPDGSFAVRSGIAKGETMRLVVREGPYLPVAPIEFQAGDTDVLIPLHAAGNATATFLVDERTPLDRLTIRLRRTQPPERLDPRGQMMQRFADRDVLYAKDGRAARNWTGLEPGTYQLTAACQGSGEPFLDIDAIQIHGGACSDPRLVDIDLRGRLRRLEIRATGTDGAPITDANAFVVVRSKGDDWNGYSLRSGVAAVATATAVDLFVLAKGYQMAAADAVTDSRSIALQPAAEAQFAVAIPSPLPDGAKVRLRLLPQLSVSRRASITLDTGRGMGLDNFFVEDVLLAADGSATMPVRWPGEYAIEGTAAMGERGGAYLRDFEPRKLTLPAAGAVTLRIGQGEFDKALQRMRR
jgi:hypothetical protein